MGESGGSQGVAREITCEDYLMYKSAFGAYGLFTYERFKDSGFDFFSTHDKMQIISSHTVF